MPEQEAIDGRQLPTESTARSFFTAFDTPLSQLMQRLSELRNAPRMTRMQKRVLVGDVNEWDKEAQKFLKAAQESEAAKQKENANRVHKFLSAMFNKVVDPVNDGRRWASGVFAQWDAEEKARLADERRQREEAARKEQERQRVEEAAHLEAQGHKEEAIAHLESPLPPVALPDAKVQPTKPVGVSVMEFFNLERIVDPKALAGYLVEHPEDLIALFEPKMAVWKSRATAAKGQWIVPGVTFIKTTQTRNRS